MNIFALNSYSQSGKVSLNLKNAKVEDVLNQIEKSSEYYFAYNQKLINVNRRIDIVANNKAIKEVLHDIFKNTQTDYIVINRQIVLSPKQIKDEDLACIQQQKKGITIIGTVTDDATGITMPGVTVMVKGTTKGTQTGTDGKYKLDLPNANAVLIFSFVGYQTETISASGKSVIDVKLKTDVKNLDEVVIVGYGTQKKVNLTGSVSVANGSVLAKRPVANAATMLEGLLPGVSVVQTSGQPGQGNVSIQIRGMGTYSGAGVNPLILIDGIPGSIESLDPNTIESVSVLKDAASASIYGSRGANGVILVTTKSGKNSDGKIQIEYNSNYGIHTPTKLLDLVTNSADYMRAWNTRIKNLNYGVDIPSREYTQTDIDTYQNATDRIQYPNFDWEHFIIKAAPTVTQNLSISGGKQTHYNLSLGYIDEKGTMEAFNYKRYNAQLNIVSEISKRLKVGSNIQLKNGITGAEATGQQNYFLCVLAQPPTIRPTLADGSGLYSWRAYPFEECNWNPYKKLKEEGTVTKDYSLVSQVWADYEIIKDLHWYIKAAANYSTSQFTGFTGNTGYERLYRDASVLGYQYTTYLSKSNSQDVYTNVYTYFTYEKKIGMHNFNLMAGYSNEEDNYNYITGYRNNYASPSTPELNAGSANGQTNSGSSNAWAMESGFGRLSYNFNEKYLLEANMRYDGTSRLSPSTRWGLFPSASVGWRLSEESFMKSAKSWLSNAKLRASWGELGNQNIGLYPYQAMLSYTGGYPFDNSSLSQGVAQTALNNQNITWEKTTTSDIGVDLTFFNKLSLTFDVYKKLTTDILRNAQVTSVVGLGAPTINGGTMQNTGFDLDMQYKDKVKTGILKDLNLGGGFTLSAFQNKLVKFGASQDNGSTIDEEGKPWNSFYLLKVVGIFQNAAQIAAAPKQFGENTQPGMLQYQDTNHDGKIDNSDRVLMTNGVFPAFSYGFNFSAEWKGFDLYGFFQGVAGSKVYVTGWGIQPFVQGSAPTKDQYANAWTPENHSMTTVELGDPLSYNHASTYFFKDNSYLRLKNLQIGYSLPSKWIKKLSMSKLRLYFAGDNLFTLTNYPGLDPERSGNGNFVNYPQSKVISFGCNVNF
jgi:TonB-linked SusC/RagA family outer membrane protein